jgi:predicted N-acetyltransferase YhbS
MGSLVTYRHWQPGDDEQILALLLAQAGWITRKGYLAKFDDPLLEPQGVHLALSGDQVVGHVMTCRRPVFMEGRPQLIGGVGQMIVDEHMRGMGIGRMLVERALDYLTIKRCRAVSLHTNRGLERAMKFYAAAGFRVWVEQVVHVLETRDSVEKSTIALRSITPEEAMPVRREWARSHFPVWCEARAFGSGEGLLGAWEGGRLVGYVQFNGEQVMQAAFVGEGPERLISPVIRLAAQRGAASITWHAALGGFWDGLLKEFARERKVTGQVRFLRPLGRDLDLSGQRPSWGTIGTW